MKILGIENVSFVDYEGKICATIFTGGCNFRCPFCHNAGIVKCNYKTHAEHKILLYLRDRKNLLDAVTISGGEPTLQPDLEDFISKIKEMGYLVKLDTNGTNPTLLKRLIDRKLIDYVAMDIKNNFDDYDTISGVIGVDVSKIKESLKVLITSNFDYELRTTLVSEFHNTDNIKKLALDLQGHKKLFLQKFKPSDTCINRNLTAVPLSLAKEFQSTLSKTILSVDLRGY